MEAVQIQYQPCLKKKSINLKSVEIVQGIVKAKINEKCTIYINE